MAERGTQQQQAARPPAEAAGIGVAGPHHGELESLSATLNAAPAVQRVAAMRPGNHTGLPDGLKAGVEALSGMSMDDVRVHRNSTKPAQLQSLAFAQGTDIHLAPGQERHLPHEAWHVVQQAQGRVRPTMQMKTGTAVNDDAGLEAEADAMGALAMSEGRARAGAGSDPQIPPKSVAIPDAISQLRVDPVAKPALNFPVAPRYADIIGPPAHYEGSGIIDDIDWVTTAQQIYQILGARAGQTPDDDDAALSELNDKENAADALVTAANAHVVTFDRTSAFNRVAIATTLNQDRRDLILLLAEIQEQFAIGGGGFGAKGRATAIAGVEIGAQHQGAVAADNSYITGVSIDGTPLANQVGVVKPAAAPVAGALRRRVNGVTRTGDPPADYADTMTAPHDQQTALDIRQFVGAARGRGQESEMGATNARGYAWATNTAGWNTTQWEWLHIRGASLGGATGPTNLVLGTRDSNTHMIPFESNLKSLAKYALDDPDNFDGVTVIWSLSGATAFAHKWSTISISWQLFVTEEAEEDFAEPRGQADFSPLATNSVLSKSEVDYLEDVLRTARRVNDREEAAEDNIVMGGDEDDGKGGGKMDDEEQKSGHPNHQADLGGGSPIMVQ